MDLRPATPSDTVAGSISSYNVVPVDPAADASHIWDIVPEINSQNEKNQNLISKSQHLVMNPAQGPHLKCAPGHKSMEDSSIIKSY